MLIGTSTRRSSWPALIPRARMAGAVEAGADRHVLASDALTEVRHAQRARVLAGLIVFLGHSSSPRRPPRGSSRSPPSACSRTEPPRPGRAAAHATARNRAHRPHPAGPHRRREDPAARGCRRPARTTWTSSPFPDEKAGSPHPPAAHPLLAPRPRSRRPSAPSRPEPRRDSPAPPPAPEATTARRGRCPRQRNPGPLRSVSARGSGDRLSDRRRRLPAWLLIFNEGDTLPRRAVRGPAPRLVAALARLMPDEPEAQMACGRRTAAAAEAAPRAVFPGGESVPLADEDPAP